MKNTPRKACQRVTKDFTIILLLTTKQNYNQLFHDAWSKIVSDSQLQNKVANLKKLVREAKKTALKKQL